MADDWYYTQSNERKGPVSPAKLKAMADEGWLIPTDLVWKKGMPSWVPAGKVRGLFGNALVQKLKDAVEGVVSKPAESEPQPDTPPAQYQPTTPTAVTATTTTPADNAQPSLDWANLKSRHLLAGCGGFVAALGIAFTAIAQSPLALAFTLSGLALVAVGMYVEVGRLLGQAIENIGKASCEAAVKAACARLQIPTPEHKTVRLFSATATGLCVQLPGWSYPVVCNIATGQLQYDNYIGHWGAQKHLNAFLQAYAVEKARIEARRKGHSVSETRLEDGSIRVTVRVGGAV